MTMLAMLARHPLRTILGCVVLAAWAVYEHAARRLDPDGDSVW